MRNVSKKVMIVGGLVSLVWAGSAHAWFRMPAWVPKPVVKAVQSVSNVAKAVVAPVVHVVTGGAQATQSVVQGVGQGAAAVVAGNPAGAVGSVTQGINGGVNALAGGLNKGAGSVATGIVEPVVNGVIQVGTTVVAPVIRPIAPDLSLPVNSLNANSFLSFSPLVQEAFSLVGAQVSPLGNSVAADEQGFKFLLPVTRIALKIDKPTAGDAMGSALDIWRIAPRRAPNAGQRVGVRLGNFQIDFNAGVVIADVKTYPLGGASTRIAVFSFRQATNLALKYHFPLGVTGKQTLDELRATSEIKDLFATGLQLRSFEVAALNVIDSYGQIDVDVDISFRSKPVPTTPYNID